VLASRQNSGMVVSERYDGRNTGVRFPPAPLMIEKEQYQGPDGGYSSIEDVRNETRARFFKSNEEDDVQSE